MRNRSASRVEFPRPFDLQDDGMMQAAVEQRGGDDGIVDWVRRSDAMPLYLTGDSPPHCRAQ
jgi:hypothetical protein